MFFGFVLGPPLCLPSEIVKHGRCGLQVYAHRLRPCLVCFPHQLPPALHQPPTTHTHDGTATNKAARNTHTTKKSKKKKKQSMRTWPQITTAGRHLSAVRGEARLGNAYGVLPSFLVVRELAVREAHNMLRPLVGAHSRDCGAVWSRERPPCAEFRGSDDGQNLSYRLTSSSMITVCQATELADTYSGVVYHSAAMHDCFFVSVITS